MRKYRIMKGNIMDYKQNEHFFDRAYNDKTNKIFVPAAIVFGLGLVFVLLGMFVGGMMRWIGNSLGWPLMIVGVVFLLIAINRKVKESDVLGEVDELVKAVNDACAEKLDFPSNLDENGVSLLGCIITEENADKAVKLKSGNYLDSDLLISYLYIKKNSVYCFRRTVSLLKEGAKDEELDIPFEAFDNVKVEADTVKDHITIHYIRFYNKKEKIFEAPLTDYDYYKDEFCEKILHSRERVIKE